jgi:hypothetical protein
LGRHRPQREQQRAEQQVITKVFQVVVSEAYRYIRLVNMGMNHIGNETLMIFAWEMIGTLLK